MIINSVALAGLVYVGAILDIPPTIVTEVNHRVFSFLWSNKNELVSRQTVFQPISKGGLGLTNISTKCKALKLNFLKKLVNPSFNDKDVLLPRYFIGRSLVKYCPTVTFLKSNHRPHSLFRPLFYDRLLSTISDSARHFPLFSSQIASVRSIYNILLQETSPRAKSESVWELALQQPNHPWSSVWESARKGLSTGFESDISWKIVHRVLKTSAYLKSWGLDIPGECDVCFRLTYT